MNSLSHPMSQNRVRVIRFTVHRLLGVIFASQEDLSSFVYCTISKHEVAAREDNSGLTLGEYLPLRTSPLVKLAGPDRGWSLTRPWPVMLARDRVLLAGSPRILYV